jgi:hypothetical protein
VRAVVLSAGGGEAAATALRAVEDQTRPPGEVVTATGLAAGVRAGLEGGEEWAWLVDDSVVPEPAALERLTEALGRLGSLPLPVLLTSRVVRNDGSLDPRSLPVTENRDVAFAVAAYERRMVALRLARSGSLLVHRRGLESFPSPRGSDMEWTARLLKREPGMLVPQSVVVRLRADERAPLEAGGRLRLLLGGSLELREKPWFAFRLAEDALARLRGRAAA